MSDPEEKFSLDEKKSQLKNLEEYIDTLKLELGSTARQHTLDDIEKFFGKRKFKTSNEILKKIEQQKQLDKNIKQKFEQMSERMNRTEQKVKSLRKKYSRS